MRIGINPTANGDERQLGSAPATTPRGFQWLIASLEVTAQNITAAESRLGDPDVVLEMVEYTNRWMVGPDGRRSLAAAGQSDVLGLLH